MNDKTPEQKAEEWANGCEKIDAFFGGLRNPERSIVARNYKRSFLQGYKAAKEEDRWIPVGERLPEESGKYLTIRWEGDLGSDLSWDADLKGWNVNSRRDTEIFPTHWRPMPQPPTKEANDNS